MSRLSFETGSALTRLDLEKVKALGSLNGVESLSYLRWLGIKNSGSIASLAPIAGLTELEGFYAWESTLVVDGDLEVLCRLPKLKTVALASRRHYRPSVAEVEALLRERRDAQGV